MSKMILIIEDEESIQNIIKAFLEDAGFTVVLAADGLEGIEQFPYNQNKEKIFAVRFHGHLTDILT